MAVKGPKVRQFLLSYQESGAELARANTGDEKVAIYEALLLDGKDALQVIRTKKPLLHCLISLFCCRCYETNLSKIPNSGLGSKSTKGRSAANTSSTHTCR